MKKHTAIVTCSVKDALIGRDEAVFETMLRQYGTT